MILCICLDLSHVTRFLVSNFLMLSVRGLSPFQSDFQVTSRVQAQHTESGKDPECLVHCEQFQRVLMLLIHQVSEEEAVSLSGPSTALTSHFIYFF